MTNQEAIKYLRDPLSLPESMDVMDKLRWHEDAVDMAIKALKAQELKNSTDVISRRAVIDALSTPHGILYPIRTVEELPSAQSEIIRCKECKYCERADDWKYRQGKGISIWICGVGHGHCLLDAVTLNDYCSAAERKNDERPD